MSTPIDACSSHLYTITRSRHESRAGHAILIDTGGEEHLRSKFCAPFAYITTVKIYKLYLSITPTTLGFMPAQAQLRYILSTELWLLRYMVKEPVEEVDLWRLYLTMQVWYIQAYTEG